MITTETIRRLLDIAEVAHDPYAVAAASLSLLAAAGPEGDRIACMHYRRALGALKLSAAARHLGGGETGEGLVAWTSRRRRFAANLRALENVCPKGATRVADAAAQGLGNFELYQAADGNWQVLDRRVPVHAGWLRGLADHRRVAEAWHYDPAQVPQPVPVLLDGVEFGWMLLRVLESTRRSYLDYSCAVYVLERDPLALAMLFHMRDLQDVIGGETGQRLRWFIGEDQRELIGEFEEALLQRPHWAVPRTIVRCALRPPAGGEADAQMDLESAIQRLLEKRAADRARLTARVATYYAGKDAAYWHQRYAAALSGAAAPLRVLGITSRYTTVLRHSMMELQAAAEASGEGRVKMEVVMEPDDQALESLCLERIESWKPDLIVQLSRMRYENPDLPREVPFLCWDQDHLPCMRTPAAAASLDALTYVAGHGALHGHMHLGWPRRNCVFCHAAAATIRYSATEVPAALRDRHACDISYVSNASETPAALAARLRGRWEADAPLAALFDRLTREVLESSLQGGCWDHLTLRNLARQQARAQDMALPGNRLDDLAADLHTCADRAYRHTTLSWVSRWCVSRGRTLRLYGAGWERHAEFARWAAGMAPPGEEARAVFQASRINLQIFQPGFIHSRALDGLAAGGFFLARFTPADGIEDADEAMLYRLARWVVDRRIESDKELDAVEDPQVREMVAAVRDWRRHRQADGPLCPVLHARAATPAAALAFPELPRITFRDEAHFARLAEHFLDEREGESRRAAIATAMRATVLRDFSCLTRWNSFLQAIEEGLGAAAGSCKPAHRGHDDPATGYQ